MSKQNKSNFQRMMNEGLLKNLISEALYKKLLPDIKENGAVFPAIRNEVIDFYHKGGRLFSYDKEGFKTHIKYASVYKNHPKPYISESMLSSLETIKNFTDGYNRIKENCSLYSGVESQGVSKMYENYSFACKKTEDMNIVILDIEVSFESIDEDRSQDRIDVLLLDKKKKRLIFCEAKHFSNGDIWAEKLEDIKVVNQIKRYTSQIKDKQEQILSAYREYINIIRDLLHTVLPVPEIICPVVPLIIFGFDRDQLKGRFKDLFKQKIGDSITYYPIGNVSAIKLENLIKQCNL